MVIDGGEDMMGTDQERWTAQQEELAEDFDGADIIGVLMTVLDFLETGLLTVTSDYVKGFRTAETNLVTDLLEQSQSSCSSPEGIDAAMSQLHEWAVLDEKIGEL